MVCGTGIVVLVSTFGSGVLATGECSLGVAGAVSRVSCCRCCGWCGIILGLLCVVLLGRWRGSGIAGDVWLCGDCLTVGRVDVVLGSRLVRWYGGLGGVVSVGGRLS